MNSNLEIRVPIETRKTGNKTLELTSGVVPVKCPVCGTGFDDKSEIVHCRKCFTIHHSDCFEYNGACATYGCECTQIQGSRNRAKQRPQNDVARNQVYDRVFCDESVWLSPYSHQKHTNQWKPEPRIANTLVSLIEHYDREICIAIDLLINMFIILIPFIFFILWRNRINLWAFMTLSAEITILSLKNEFIELL